MNVGWGCGHFLQVVGWVRHHGATSLWNNKRQKIEMPDMTAAKKRLILLPLTSGQGFLLLKDFVLKVTVVMWEYVEIWQENYGG